MKARLEKLLAEYGKVALITYLVLSGLAITGFSVAIAIGASPSSATGFFGVIAAGWLAAKATMPLRILTTLALTPMVAAIVRRFGRRDPDAEPAAADGHEDKPAADPALVDDPHVQANAGK